MLKFPLLLRQFLVQQIDALLQISNALLIGRVDSCWCPGHDRGQFLGIPDDELLLQLLDLSLRGAVLRLQFLHLATQNGGLLFGEEIIIFIFQLAMNQLLHKLLDQLAKESPWTGLGGYMSLMLPTWQETIEIPELMLRIPQENDK